MAPAELRPTLDGWTCQDHPGYAPEGLGRSHALNSMAKHNRDHHAQEVRDADVSDLVGIIQGAGTAKGLNLADARVLAATILDAGYAKPPF